MTTIQFRRPTIARLHRATAPVPPAGEFRVTQHFNTPDYYWSNVPNPPNPLPTHNAVDIGNFRCNDPIVAMAPGTAYRIKDNATSLGAATDALGVRIDHGYGITTEYWHLNGWTITDGQKVNAGQQVGILGSTGLGAVCHTHIEAKRDGVRFDPEPLMFGGSLTVDDMQYPRPNRPFLLADIGAGNRLRSAPTLTADSIALTLDSLATVGVFSYVEGASWNGSNLWAWIGYDSETYCVHSKLLSNLRPTADLPVSGTGITQAELDAAKAAAQKAGFADAKTKARVAVEAIK